jgi:hypothetical protein
MPQSISYGCTLLLARGVRSSVALFALFFFSFWLPPGLMLSVSCRLPVQSDVQ